MLRNPAEKYRAFPTVALKNRQWPNRTITQAPVWMSTDLRDGNQSLIEPMSIERKLCLFEMLVNIGFKQIEVAFPSASQTDFDFVRRLIEENRIPDDVAIEVLTPSREDLIHRTFESLRGARRAIVHQYNAIAPTFRRIVFAASRDEVHDLALSGARQVKTLAAERPETDWTFQYSPETFSMAELAFAHKVCDAVTEIWQPTRERAGNVDRVTLALNLYTQGVDPRLELSDIDAVRHCVEECNQLPVHPRHPYVGDLVHTAFSGSHPGSLPSRLNGKTGVRKTILRPCAWPATRSVATGFVAARGQRYRSWTRTAGHLRCPVRSTVCRSLPPCRRTGAVPGI